MFKILPASNQVPVIFQVAFIGILICGMHDCLGAGERGDVLEIRHIILFFFLC
jgi:hypothetical protein